MSTALSGAALAMAGRYANGGHPLFRERDVTWEATAWGGFVAYGGFYCPVVGAIAAWIGLILGMVRESKAGRGR